VNELAKSHGYKVERLPPHYCIFNPIEHIWGIAKHIVRKHNANPTANSQIVDMVRDVMNNITAETWSNCVEHVKKVEKEYLAGNMEVIHPVVVSSEDLLDSSDCDSEKEN